MKSWIAAATVILAGCGGAEQGALVSLNAMNLPATGETEIRPSGLSTQSILFFDSYEAANDGAAGPTFDALPLVAGRTYQVTVEGTYSFWVDSWQQICGTPEAVPMYPSPGRYNHQVGLDAETMFAVPNHCSALGYPVPSARTNFQFSLNGGTSWSHVSPATSDFTNHRYTYRVIGQGHTLGLRLLDNPTTDNYGMFKVTIEPLDEDGDGIPDNEDFCPSTASSDLSTGVPSQGLGVNRWADLDGDAVFDTVYPQGQGPRLTFTLRNTAGCNCAQIIARLALGEGHTRFGCSISAMREWVAQVSANP